MHYLSQLRIPVALAGVLFIAGCAGIPADRGFSSSQALIKSHGGPDTGTPVPDAEAKRLTAEWLAAPLTIESAQRVALTRNPRLLQQYARLGIAQAALYDAARLSNPVLSFAWLDSSAGAAQVGAGLAQNFAELLYLSPRKRRASGELARSQQQVAGELLDLAAEVERAYYAYVGASSVAELRAAIATAGEASAQLAQRFFDAGNISRLELNRELAAATETRIASDRAVTQTLAARAELNTLLGLTAEEDRWNAASQLRLPVNTEDELSFLQTMAQGTRLDLLAARRSVVILEDVLGVTRSYRLLGDTRVGARYEHESDHSNLIGPTLAIDLPVFNWGGGKVERARAELDLARAEARRLEIEISNAVHLAQARVAMGRDQVKRYRTELVPQRDEVVVRAMEMQNFMIIGQFELLQAKREAYDAYQGYLQALADYWMARAELARAIGTRLPSSAQIEFGVIEPTSLLTPKEPSASMNGIGNHSAYDLRPSEAKPTPVSPAGHDMKGMKPMDGSDQSMEAMSEPDAEQPADEKAACERLETADMNDPLMQALVQKCRELAQPGRPSSGDHANHTSTSTTPPATGGPPADNGQQPSVGEHKH